MSAILTEPTPDPGNRLSLTLFLALVLHALVILGVGFEMLTREGPDQVTLDVTWVEIPSQEPDVAQHIAVQAQEASGDADEIQPARSLEPRPMEDTGPALEPLETPPTLAEAVPTASLDPLTAVEPDPAPRPEEFVPAEILDPRDQPSAAMLIARGLEAARSLPHESEQSLLSRASRTLYLDTLAARSAPEASYLEAWIRKVERIGNLNYPDEARRRGLSGSLVLSVRLDAEGRVQDIAIAQSSGEPVLDEAAIRIVELAQPFAPFTEAMREQYDHMVITRTWAFRRDRVERGR